MILQSSTSFCHQPNKPVTPRYTSRGSISRRLSSECKNLWFTVIFVSLLITHHIQSSKIVPTLAVALAWYSGHPFTVIVSCMYWYTWKKSDRCYNHISHCCIQAHFHGDMLCAAGCSEPDCINAADWWNENGAQYSAYCTLLAFALQCKQRANPIILQGM